MKTHLDLFSGIGGFALAAHWAGFTTIGFCECEKYCQRILQKHWPDVPIHPDIRELDGTRYRGVTLLTAGVPCQPSSQAGEYRGYDDHRWIWPEGIRILREVSPIWAVFENVAGLLNVNSGLAFEGICTDLEESCYEVQPVIIPACAAGAWQSRNRVWILAHAMRGVETLGWNISGNRRVLQYAPKSPIRQMQDSPAFLGGADGVPKRMDRLRCLGNAIVPQVAYQILKHMIIDERGKE